MTKSSLNRRHLLLTSAVALAGVVPSVGHPQSSERPIEGGIGGTGIVGLLTEFGSLYINGNYVRTDTQTRYSNGFGSITKTDLSVGDSLTVEAATDSEGLIAARVHVTHPIVGSITAIAANGRSLTINGITVTLPSRTRFGIGTRVAASGLWRGQQVVASRITATNTALDLISGDARRQNSNNFIGTTRIRGAQTANMQRGAFTTVTGTYQPDRETFQAQRIVTGRFVGAAGALSRLSVEGYLEPTDRAPGFRLAGLGHSFAQNLQLSPYASSRVLFSGPYTGKFAANKATVLPEAAGPRSRLLRQLRNRG